MSIDLQELIDVLRSYFSNKIPTKVTTTIDDIRILQGQQQVITYIQNILDNELRKANEASKPKQTRKQR